MANSPNIAPVIITDCDTKDWFFVAPPGDIKLSVIAEHFSLDARNPDAMYLVDLCTDDILYAAPNGWFTLVAGSRYTAVGP